MIFIIGNSRSGTKLVGEILNNHSEIFTFTELHYFEQLVDIKKIKKPCSREYGILLIAKLFSIQENGYLNPMKFNSNYLEKYIPVAKKIYEIYNIYNYIHVYTSFIDYYTKKIANKKFACDPTPRNQFFIRQLCENILDAKFVYMLRDPRAVLYSQKKNGNLV